MPAKNDHRRFRDADYLVALDEIYHVGWVATRVRRIQNLRGVIERLWPSGHPTRLVRVAGTSGKGSTARFIEAALAMDGPAGALLSPHLFDYAERFSVRGNAVSHESIAAIWNDLLRELLIESSEQDRATLPFPDVTLLLGLCLFASENLKWAAIEASVGGRYDHTQAVEPVVAALTNVGDDHRGSLGDQPWQRALDKAGVAHAGVPLISSESDPDLCDLIQAVCDDRGSAVRFITAAEIERVADHVATLDVADRGLLANPVQIRNATLALAVAQYLVPELALPEALARMGAVRLVGRFSRRGRVLFDVAHNPDKVAATAQHLREAFPDAQFIVVCGVSSGRDPIATLGPLVPLGRRVVVTQSRYRGRDADEVASALSQAFTGVAINVVPDPRQALCRAFELAQDTDLVLVTGSTFVVDEAMNPDPRLAHINASAGWRHRRDS